MVRPDCKSGAWRHGRFDPCHTHVAEMLATLKDLIWLLPEWKVRTEYLFLPAALLLQWWYEMTRE